VRIFLPFLLLTCRLVAGEAFNGTVVAVYDRDTITVDVTAQWHTVRLFGIDCPELRQPGGDETRFFTSDIALGRSVRVAEMDKDRYGCVVAVITLPDGLELNKALLRGGHAWWFRKYAPNAGDLQIVEAEARSSQRGLWAGSNPVSPGEWRGGHEAAPTATFAPKI
jgi:endonuclease YncB( thermonuclease family)